MSDILSLVSLALQLWDMGWPIKGQVRTSRIETGEAEINLGFYRRRVTWTQRRRTQR